MKFSITFGLFLVCMLACWLFLKHQNEAKNTKVAQKVLSKGFYGSGALAMMQRTE